MSHPVSSAATTTSQPAFVPAYSQMITTEPTEPSPDPATVPLTMPSAPTASASRLPDVDVFTTFGEVQPGNLPLLIRMPDGMCEQVEVPLTSTIDDLKTTLQRRSTDDLRFSFGNADLDPSATLLDANIVDAYEHAGSLLHVIGSGNQDVNTKAAALDSACAVVESISNGIKDMEALCKIAANQDTNLQLPDTDADTDTQPPPPPPPPPQSQPSQPHPQDLRTMQQNHSAEPVELVTSYPKEETPDDPSQPTATPSALAHSLSRRLPNLFPPAAAAAAFPAGKGPNDKPRPPPTGPTIPQPSIASIREARRQRSKARAQSSEALPSTDEQDEDDSRIGISTYAHPLPDRMNDASNHLAAHAKGGDAAQPPPSNVVLAQSGKTTWLDDVMKTWEIGAVRQSGVLEKTKDGQEIHQYLDGLEAEAETDAINENPSGEGVDNTDGLKSSDEEEEYEDEDVVGNTHGRGNESQSTSSADGSRGDVSMADSGTGSASPATASQTSGKPLMPAGMPQMQDGKWAPDGSMATWNKSGADRVATAAAAGKGRTTGKPVALAPTPPPLAGVPSHPSPRGAGLQAATPSTGASTPSITSGSTMEANLDGAQSSTPSSARPQRAPTRRPLPMILPAPMVDGTALPMVPNGGMLTPVFQGFPPQPGTWMRPTVTPPGPKKRGRKRKNPELTEEERALVRKEQNRESARLSRVRRKVIAAEYEGRLNELVNENSLLKRQVEGLNNRLAYLQSILTVTVRQEPPSRQ